MELNLSLAALVNAAGAFLFFVGGLWVVAVARTSHRGRLVGATAATFGLTFIVENLFDYNVSPWSGVIVAAVAALAIVVAVRLVVVFARDASRPWQRIVFAVAAVALLNGLAWGFVTSDAAGRVLLGPKGDLVLDGLAVGLVQTYQGVLMLLVAAIVGAYRAAPADRRVPWALLAAAIGMFALLINVENAVVPAFLPALGIQVSALFYLYAATQALRGVAAVVIVLGVLVPRPAHPPSARLLFVALAVAALAGALLQLVFGLVDQGEYGIVRTFGMAFFAVAVTRSDLLQVPLPRVVVRQGAVATATLAVLFMVAQVAENFLQSSYGLMVGSVVAGGFLFAAHPLQRVLERVGGGGGPSNAPGSFPMPDVARREEAYLAAARLAMRDRMLSRDEEAELHGLAEQLGIGGRRAHELLVQAERESSAA